MNDTINYTVKETHPGLVQANFENGYTLSIGFGAGHYATYLFGSSRLGKPGFIPTSYEIAVLDPNGDFIKLTEYDDVAGQQSLDMVQTILQKMERDNFDPKDLELYCD